MNDDKSQGRTERKWNDKFIEYMSFIANDPNYAGMPDKEKEDGTVRWVVTRNSDTGKRRDAWWENKRKQLGVSTEKGWKATVARMIHPTKSKPCQICGRVLRVDYVYPRKSLIEKINREFEGYNAGDFKPIEQIVQEIAGAKGKEGLKRLQTALEISVDSEKTPAQISDEILQKYATFLSPGAMGDAPDRFDGFHSYNICCRSNQDKGRHADNLRTYGEDRRAYVFWNDGDWKTAAWLMQEFRKKGVSPDHVGPISLGFKPILQGTTLRENIDKRNRLRLQDVQFLIQREKTEEVACWYTKPLWNKLKAGIGDDAKAEDVGKMLRINLHFVLAMFADIKKAGHEKFLIKNFLHPEYAYYKIKFKKFDPKTGEYEVEKIPGDKKQYENNAKRYIRKSFDALDKYMAKGNRRIQRWKSKKADALLVEIKQALAKRDESKAKKLIGAMLEAFAEELIRGGQT